jgi:tRNA C32,U32 (ribose-2'-O)-methylase TrmJ
MHPRIVLVPPSDEIGDIARQMAPAGFDLYLTKPDGSDVATAVATAAYMVCYPNVITRFLKGAPARLCNTERRL